MIKKIKLSLIFKIIKKSMQNFSIKQTIKPHIKLFGLAQLGLILETCIELSLPLILAKMMDDGVLQGSISNVVENGIYYIILLIFSGLSITCFSFFSAKASNNFSSDLRKYTFEHIHALKMSEVQKISTGSLITRLTSDINILQDSLNLIFRFALRAPLMFGGGIVMLLFLNTNFALILVFTLIIQIIVVYYVLSKTQPMYERVQKNLDVLNIVSQENIAGAKTIKAFTANEKEFKRFDFINHEVADSLFKVQRLMSILAPVFMLVMNIALALLLYIGAFSVEKNDLQIGEIMAAISYLTQILFALMMLAMIFPNLAKARISYKRIMEIFQLEIEEDSKFKKNITVLDKISGVEFKDVCFNYSDAKDSTPILEKINFRIHEGEKVAILGATGAGKSSLIKLLFGVYQPSCGEILINNIPIDFFSIKDLREQITYVLQKIDLFSGSIYDNITFGDEKISQEDVYAAAKIAHAHNFISDFNQAYEEELGSKGVGVSGGQKQRINLSRAFLRKSSLLILDDCTSALDLRTENNVYSAIMESKMHSMLILISQKVSSVMNFDKIYILDKGKIVDYGNHSELKSNSLLYQNICKSQNITD